MQKTLLALSISCLFSANISAASYRDFDIESLQALSLKDLLNVQVESASLKQSSLINAPANIKIVTHDQIRQRGYQTLIDVLRDVPGFDFANHLDSAGEYTSHSVNRGIGGTPGNVQLLIMIDGIVQNHIAFNWSQPWGNQQIFSDIERIEIVQGPGSASYGANAYSGVVHFITKSAKEHPTAHASALIGQDNTRSYQFMVNHAVSDLYLQLAGRFFSTSGDNGLDSYDPAGYFQAHAYPNILTEQYVDGILQVNTPSPLANTFKLAGYNNFSDDDALRGKVTWQPENTSSGLNRLEFGFNHWQQAQGLGSYVTGFEYQTRDKSYQKVHQAEHYYVDFDIGLSPNIELESRIWYRKNQQKPKTGFKYSYRFVDLIKSYHSLSEQNAIEQQLNINDIFDSDLQIGYRLMRSDKMGQITSLGRYQLGEEANSSSDWLMAIQGLGLNQYAQYDVETVDEQAVYVQAQGKLFTQLDYTLGLRFDHSDAFGNTFNPRAALNYHYRSTADDKLVFKLLFGEAFREPSIFELNDEFRGNESLEPEKVRTVELVSQYFKAFNSQQIDVKTAVYFSHEQSRIALDVDDSPGGSRYQNQDDTDYFGITIDANYSLDKDLAIYLNYHYTDGGHVNHNSALDHSANHKFNWGIHYQATDYLAVNFRANHLVSQNVPNSNSYFDNKAPSLSLYNLVLSSKDMSFAGIKLSPQLIVKNVFDKKYVLVGRQDGSSDIKLFNPNTNVNPFGFAPPYHPQQGRTVALNFNITF